MRRRGIVIGRLPADDYSIERYHLAIVTGLDYGPAEAAGSSRVARQLPSASVLEGGR